MRWRKGWNGLTKCIGTPRRDGPVRAGKANEHGECFMAYERDSESQDTETKEMKEETCHTPVPGMAGRDAESQAIPMNDKHCVGDVTGIRWKTL